MEAKLARAAEIIIPVIAGVSMLWFGFIRPRLNKNRSSGGPSMSTGPGQATQAEQLQTPGHYNLPLGVGTASPEWGKGVFIEGNGHKQG